MADEALVNACEHKEAGNGLFASGDTEGALGEWKAALALAAPLNESNSGEEQTRALIATLHSNVAMGHSKLGRPREAIAAASAALEVDPAHIKSLYRRGVARRKVGDTELAKTDLLRALELDPALRDAKRELAAVRKDEADALGAEKRAFAAAFAGGASLYTDKAGEAAAREKQKAREEAARAAAETEDLRQATLLSNMDYDARRKRWEDQCVQRLGLGGGHGDVPSFADWDRAEREKEEAARIAAAAREKRTKAHAERPAPIPAAKPAAKPAAQPAAKPTVSGTGALPWSTGGAVVVEDEEDLKKGYKTRADGRKTTFFNHDLDDEAKRLIGDIAPKRIDPGAGPAESPRSTVGAWEEHDVSAAACAALARLLGPAAVPGTASGVELAVLGVSGGASGVSGDAQVCILRGKKKAIFELGFALRWRLQGVFDGAVGDITGATTFADVASGSVGAASLTDGRVVLDGSPGVGGGAGSAAVAALVQSWVQSPAKGLLPFVARAIEQLTAELLA
jgi:tetratricopeptide (TPR) repeat protein